MRRSLLLLVGLSVILASCSPGLNESTPFPEKASPLPTRTVQSSTIKPSLVETIAPTVGAPAPSQTLTSSVTFSPTPPTIQLTMTPPPSQGRIAGIEINPGMVDADLALVEQAGAAWIRVNALIWSDVEPFEGRRDWSALQSLENLLMKASEQELETILIVRGTPSWARIDRGSKCGRIRENKINAFAEFVSDLVNRYSITPFNVKYWEIWNEPDVDPSIVRFDSIYGCWGDQDEDYYGGWYYGELLQAIYPKMKAAQPDIKVVIGGLLMDCDPNHPPEWPIGSGNMKDCSSSRFLEGILESGAVDYFDAISFHAYDYYGEQLGAYGNLNWNSTWNMNGPVVIKKAEYLTDLLAGFGAEKELLNTENAMICGSSQAICATEDYDLTKAYYAAISLGAGRMLGLTANIWYSITGWRESGLVNRSYQPLPVFDSYRFGIQQLDRAVFRRLIDDYPGLTGYEFDRDGTLVWLIWSPDDVGGTIQLPEPPDAVYDVFGNSLPAGSEFTVSAAPAYLEWMP